MLQLGAAATKLGDETNKTLLSESSFATLCQQLGPHAASWKTIGVNLGFPPGELDNIQSNPINMIDCNAPKSFLNDLLKKWLQWMLGHPATLEDLKVALRKTGLGRAAAELTA